MVDSDQRRGILAPLRILLTLLLATGVIFRSYEPAAITIPYTDIPIPGLPESAEQLIRLAYLLFWWSVVVAIAIVLLEWDQLLVERNRRLQAAATADRERDQTNRERQRAAFRAALQSRSTVLQIRHQLEDGPETRAALRDFLALLEEYGEDI